MTNWKSRIATIIRQADDLSDALQLRLKRITGYDSPLKIIPYLGYGTASKLFLNGRVVEAEPFIPAEDADTALENLLNMFRRFKSDEVPGARVRAHFEDFEQEVITNQEGYFSLELKPRKPLAHHLWQEIELELLEPQSKDGQPVRAIGQILVPPPSAKFGVISDIDDTVVWTNVVNKLKMILTIFLLNERTRVPFKGVAGFYRALQRGVSGSEHNPIFYVSSSPWNLYDLLVEFFRLHGIPIGPLFLRDFGDDLIFSAREHHGHKLSKIEPILELYPHLPFILIGDNGEKDPEIYRDVVRKYPDRIRAVYIRSVNPDPARIAGIDALVEEVSQVGCQLILTPDSEFAATHAAAEGLISTEALAEVRSQKKADESAPSATEILAEVD